MTASGCCAPTRARRPPASRPCSRRSSGATTCSTCTSRCCCAAWRCSPAASSCAAVEAVCADAELPERDDRRRARAAGREVARERRRRPAGAPLPPARERAPVRGRTPGRGRGAAPLRATAGAVGAGAGRARGRARPARPRGGEPARGPRRALTRASGSATASRCCRFWLRRIDLEEAHRRFIEALAGGSRAHRAARRRAARGLGDRLPRGHARVRRGPRARGHAIARRAARDRAAVASAAAPRRIRDRAGRGGPPRSTSSRRAGLARREGLAAEEAVSVYSLGVARWRRGSRRGRGADQRERAVAALRSAGSRGVDPLAAEHLRDPPRRRPSQSLRLRIVFEETLQPFFQISCEAAVGYVLANQATIARLRGEPAQARAAARRSAAPVRAQRRRARARPRCSCGRAYLELATGAPDAGAAVPRGGARDAPAPERPARSRDGDGGTRARGDPERRARAGRAAARGRRASSSGARATGGGSSARCGARPTSRWRASASTRRRRRSRQRAGRGGHDRTRQLDRRHGRDAGGGGRAARRRCAGRGPVRPGPRGLPRRRRHGGAAAVERRAQMPGEGLQSRRKGRARTTGRATTTNQRRHR